MLQVATISSCHSVATSVGVCRAMVRLRGCHGWLVAAALTLLSPIGLAIEIPQPLTLAQLMALATHPQATDQQLQAETDRLRARQQAVAASVAPQLLLEGRARWIDPPTLSPNQESEDHRLALVARWPIYDGGDSQLQQQALEVEQAGMPWRQQRLLAQRQTALMRLFFDILLADQRFDRDNEVLAIAFIQFDRLRVRHGMGQASPVELAAAESRFQLARSQLQQSQSRQQLSRARLALALGAPEAQIVTLTSPDLTETLTREVPPLAELTAALRARNPELQVLQQQIAAAELRVQAARRGARPRLVAEAEVAHYSREVGSNDGWRAGVAISLPLLDGGGVDAAVASALAEVSRLRAELEQRQLALHEVMMSYWYELQDLRIKRNHISSQGNWREIYLDRSRTLYQMEQRADIGDAMIELTNAELEAMAHRFDTAIAWAHLDALISTADRSSP
jgi:outer membrane protein TolC